MNNKHIADLLVFHHTLGLANFRRHVVSEVLFALYMKILSRNVRK